MQIGDPDAFTFFAGQCFVIGTFAGRHDDLLPLVEQAARDNPGILPFEIAYAIICAAVGATRWPRRSWTRGWRTGSTGLPVDNMWTTSVIGYAVLAIELEDADAAAQLLPVIEPFAGAVSFNGVTSQGPIAAYVGKLASLVGEHDLAEDHLRAALETATRSAGSTTAPPRSSRSRRRGIAGSAVSTTKRGRGSPRPPSCAAPAASTAGSPRSTSSGGRAEYIG